MSVSAKLVQDLSGKYHIEMDGQLITLVGDGGSVNHMTQRIVSALRVYGAQTEAVSNQAANAYRLAQSSQSQSLDQ